MWSLPLYNYSQMEETEKEQHINKMTKNCHVMKEKPSVLSRKIRRRTCFGGWSGKLCLRRQHVYRAAVQSEQVLATYRWV